MPQDSCQGPRLVVLIADGRPAAVHWQLAADFKRRHPEVDLRPDVLFIDDGDILTSAGSAATRSGRGPPRAPRLPRRSRPTPDACADDATVNAAAHAATTTRTVENSVAHSRRYRRNTPGKSIAYLPLPELNAGTFRCQ